MTKIQINQYVDASQSSSRNVPFAETWSFLALLFPLSFSTLSWTRVSWAAFRDPGWRPSFPLIVFFVIFLLLGISMNTDIWLQCIFGCARESVVVGIEKILWRVEANYVTSYINHDDGRKPSFPHSLFTCHNIHSLYPPQKKLPKKATTAAHLSQAGNYLYILPCAYPIPSENWIMSG